MTKKLLFLILFFFVANIAFSQRFDGGALLGLNASQVEGDSFGGYKKPGLAAGFYVETDLAPAVFAAFEIKYSQKGVRKNYTEKDPTQYLMRLNYIDLPIYAGFRTNEWGALIAGIQPGYLLSANEFNAYGEVPPEDQNEFNKFDLQVLAGFQFDIIDRLKADLRLAFSVIHISDNPGDTNYYTKDGLFNNVITLGVYYQIGTL